MKFAEKIFSFITKKYSVILVLIFLFAIIFVAVFYFRIYKKVNTTKEKIDKNVINESKLEKIIKRIQSKEKEYLESVQKNYQDVFK